MPSSRNSTATKSNPASKFGAKWGPYRHLSVDEVDIPDENGLAMWRRIRVAKLTPMDAQIEELAAVTRGEKAMNTDALNKITTDIGRLRTDLDGMARHMKQRSMVRAFMEGGGASVTSEKSGSKYSKGRRSGRSSEVVVENEDPDENVMSVILEDDGGAGRTAVEFIPGSVPEGNNKLILDLDSLVKSGESEKGSGSIVNHRAKPDSAKSGGHRSSEKSNGKKSGEASGGVVKSEIVKSDGGGVSERGSKKSSNSRVKSESVKSGGDPASERGSQKPSGSRVKSESEKSARDGASERGSQKSPGSQVKSESAKSAEKRASQNGSERSPAPPANSGGVKSGEDGASLKSSVQCTFPCVKAVSAKSGEDGASEKRSENSLSPRVKSGSSRSRGDPASEVIVVKIAGSSSQHGSAKASKAEDPFRTDVQIVASKSEGKSSMRSKKSKSGSLRNSAASVKSAKSEEKSAAGRENSKRSSGRKSASRASNSKAASESFAASNKTRAA